jgi:transposase
MAAPPWIVPDELWELIEPLLPAHPRRLRYRGCKALPDRPALCDILFLLHTGIAWRHLPPEQDFGSGITCRRRLDEWQNPGQQYLLGTRRACLRVRAADAGGREGDAPHDPMTLTTIRIYTTSSKLTRGTSATSLVSPTSHFISSISFPQPQYSYR